MIRAFLCIMLSLFPAFSEAAGELSFWLLFTQGFNFSLFFLAFLFLVRKPIKLLCHQRQKDFFAFEKQALALEKQKKEENKEWEEKIVKLELREKSIKRTAEEEGSRFQFAKQKDLKDLEESLKKHSDFLIQLETEKLKKQQLDHWRQKLVQFSQKQLEDLAKHSSFQQKEKQNFVDFLKEREVSF